MWLTTLKLFVPVAGAVVVLPAWLLACRAAWADPVAGSLASWFFIASIGVMRYFSSYRSYPDWLLPAYAIALPSFLLVAWATAHGFARSRSLVNALSAAGLGAVVLPMAVRAVQDRYDPTFTVKAPRYFELKDKCAVVKAASAYVREDGPPESTVLQLTTDNQLGVMGEFYYGISYVGNNQTGERNPLLDYGTIPLGRRYTPNELASLYGVRNFDYYVEFLPADAFTEVAVDDLRRSGAQVSLEIRDRTRLIGRVISFKSRPVSVIEVDSIASRWDRVGHLSQLFRQSLAGTSFHFGYSWPRPAE